VELEWTRPSEDGGSPITGYVIEKKDKFRFVFTYSSSALDISYGMYILLISILYRANEKCLTKLRYMVTHTKTMENSI
jgi:hypothetical protein